MNNSLAEVRPELVPEWSEPEMVQGSVKGTEDAVKEIIARYQ